MSVRSIARASRTFKATTVDPIYVAAEAAFFRDDLTSCTILLDLARPTEPSARARVALLRARVARLSGDTVLWHREAIAAAAVATEAQVRFSAMALAAVAAHRLGKRAEAAKRFESLDKALHLATPRDGSYARYLVALEAWIDREYDRSERLAREALALASDDGDVIALLGWIQEKREKYVEAGAHFRRALAIVRRSDPVPTRHHGTLLLAVTAVACETADIASLPRLVKEYERGAWSDRMRVIQFNVLDLLRLAALLQGDEERAWFVARDALAVAPEGAYRVMAEVELAARTSALGDEKTALIQFRHASKLMQRVRWADANAEERSALLDFAGTTATVLPSDARRALMLYISLREKEQRDHSLTNDRRVRAQESFAAARVAEVLAERAEAIAHYRAALTTWQELGFVSRAAETAYHLLRMTRDQSYRSPITALAERAPDAWIVREAKSLAGPLGQLGPIQRRILAKLLRGDGAKAIAEDLNRSKHTVINHTRTIFAAFEVRSRAELRRRCALVDVRPESLSRDDKRSEGGLPSRR